MVEHIIVDNMPDRISTVNEGELRPFLVQAHNRGGRSTFVLLEDDGTVRTWSLNVYRDAAGNERVGLIDTNRVPWTREFEDCQVVDPVLLTNVEADLFDPAGTVDQVFAVEFNVVNIDPASLFIWGVNVGHAVGGGALAANEFILTACSYPVRGASGWHGPYLIRGNDTIRGYSGAVNDAVIHFRVCRKDIGA